MTLRITVVAGLLILLAWGTVFAAESAAPADKPQAVFLWPDGAPGAKGDTLEDKPRTDTDRMPSSSATIATLIAIPIAPPNKEMLPPN